jgi:hypothetical protein
LPLSSAVLTLTRAHRWLRDKRHGEGTYSYGECDEDNAGDVYQGPYSHDVRHGLGTYVPRAPRGGQWQWGRVSPPPSTAHTATLTLTLTLTSVNRRANHHPRYIWEDGTVFTGQYVNNTQHGEGQTKWLDGTVYSGDYEHDHRTGEGKLTFRNGDVYRGTFHESRKVEGQGQLTLALDPTAPVGTQQVTLPKGDVGDRKSKHW